MNQLGIAENTINAALYAFLAVTVGIAIVAVGGGIKMMLQRWEQAAARYDEEKPKVAQQMVNVPLVKDQAAQNKTGSPSVSQSAPRDGRAPVTGAHRS